MCVTDLWMNWKQMLPVYSWLALCYTTMWYRRAALQILEEEKPPYFKDYQNSQSF